MSAADYFDIACQRIYEAQESGKFLDVEPAREHMQEGLL